MNQTSLRLFKPALAAMTLATLASPAYGCTFTKNTPSTEDFTSPTGRAAFQANYPACPVN